MWHRAPVTSAMVRALNRHDLPAATEVLAKALQEDPFFRAIEPDATERRPVLRRQMAGALRYAFHHGLVEATPNLGGVAVWLPPGHTHVTLSSMLTAGPRTLGSMMALPPAAIRRAMPFRKPIDDLHRRSVPDPHWYLWILGVDPRHQRQGLGTTLVRHRLTEVDSTAAYVETAKRSTVDYYARFGFEGTGIVKIPEMRVTIWGMLLPAHQRTSSG